MFKKKFIPEGILLPTLTRIVLITHLSFVFIYLSLHFLYPYLGSHFEMKQRRVELLSLMGSEDLNLELPNLPDHELAQLKLNRSHFNSLSVEEQSSLQTLYNETVNSPAQNSSFSQAMDSLLNHHPLFLLSWLFFSTVIPLMILMRIEGAAQSAFLLPLIALCFSLYNVWYGSPIRETHEQLLFPSESYLVKEYIPGSLGKSVDEQHQQLQEAWNLYLLDHWLPKSEKNAGDKDLLARANYHFSIARLKAKLQDTNDPYDAFQKRSPLFLALFIAWNLFVWGYVQRKEALA